MEEEVFPFKVNDLVRLKVIDPGIIDAFARRNVHVGHVYKVLGVDPVNIAYILMI